jgi:large conductance mechanosensitive channel
MLKGFRDFILRGNVLDLAVGVVIGAAFGAVVTSFTKDVLMQAISAIVGKPDFKDVVWSLNGTPIYVGNFFTALISFLLVAGAVYFAVILPVNAMMNRMRKPVPVAAATTKKCSECTLEIPLEAKRCPNCTSPVSDAVRA